MSGNTNPNRSAAPDNFIQDFSGLTDRAQEFLRQDTLGVYDIRDFGARVDNSTDDSAALLLAIEEATENGGGEVFIPRGTTRIASKIQAGSAQFPHLTIRGISGASIIRFDSIGQDRGISLPSWESIVLRDLCFVGSSGGGISTAGYENNGSVIYTDAIKTVYYRCNFYGIATNSQGAFANSGLILCDNAQLYMKHCIFAACTSIGGGVVQLTDSYGAVFEDVYFVDFAQFNEVFYNKLSIQGNTKNWICSLNPTQVEGGSQRPVIEISNCGFDENTTDGLVNLTGLPDQTALIRNSSFASGFGGALAPPVKFDTFQEVEISNTDFGLHLNLTGHETARFTDCERVRLKNFRHKYGAEWITLAGTTGRLIRHGLVELQGNGTFPTGIDNTAAAAITVYE